jgi:hypothetical protein
VVQRLAALLGGGDGDLQVVLQLLLANELAQPPGAQRRVQGLFVFLRFAGDDAFRGRRAPRF